MQPRVQVLADLLPLSQHDGNTFFFLIKLKFCFVLSFIFSRGACGGQKTTFASWVFPFTMGVWGSNLGFQVGSKHPCPLSYPASPMSPY